MPWQPVPFFGLVGGLNDVLDATMLRENPMETPNAEDVSIKGIDIRTRNGKEKYNLTEITGTPAITGLYLYRKWNGDTYFVCAAGTDLYKDVSGTWTALSGSFTAGANNFWDFAVHGDLMIATNGIEHIQKWDGTTLADLTTDPTDIEYVEEFWDRLIACGNPTNPYRIWWSNLGDPTTWTVTDYLDIPRALKITGMKKLGRVLYIFSRNQTFAFYYTGDPNIPFRQETINNEIGCIAGFSIVESNGWLYFVSEHGFVRFNGTAYENLSEQKIHNYFLASIDADRMQHIIGTNNQERRRIEWLFTTTGGTQHNKILAYDYVHRAWLRFNKDANYIYQGYEVSDLTWDDIEKTWDEFGDETWEDFHSEFPRLWTGDYAGFVYRDDYGSDENESGIAAYYETKWLFFENPELKKIMRYLQVYTLAEGNYNLTIKYRWDFASSWNSLTKNLSAVGMQGEVLRPRFATKGSGHYLQLRFENSTANQPFELVGFIVFLKKLRGAVRAE